MLICIRIAFESLKAQMKLIIVVVNSVVENNLLANTFLVVLNKKLCGSTAARLDIWY